MKVQLRDERYRIGPWKVVEEAPSYYIAKDPDHGGITLLRKADYEPVQEWVDITADCYFTLVDSHNKHYALCYHSDVVASKYHVSKYRVTQVGDGCTKVEVKL